MDLRGPLRVGVGGPVGSGKTALVERLCKKMRGAYDIAVVTNDIYTKEDAEFLTRAGALAPERIVGVETGGCPHTAIREDASINLAATTSRRPSRPNWPISRSMSSTSPPARRFRARVAPASPGQTCWSSTRSTWRRMSAPRSR